jgi:hypothetical protein
MSVRLEFPLPASDLVPITVLPTGWSENKAAMEIKSLTQGGIRGISIRLTVLKGGMTSESHEHEHSRVDTLLRSYKGLQLLFS